MEKGRDAKAKGPAHGDELAYIFEPLDDEGKSVGGEVSSTDARVRNNFVSLIAKFAHDLSPMERTNKSKLSFSPFSKNNDQFLKIGEEITLDKDFRFCQIGLWGNMADRVTGAFCKNVLGNLLNLPKLPGKIPEFTDPVANIPQAVTSLIPNIFGAGGKKKKSSEPEIVQVTRKPNNGGGIAGIFRMR